MPFNKKPNPTLWIFIISNNLIQGKKQYTQVIIFQKYKFNLKLKMP